MGLGEHLRHDCSGVLLIVPGKANRYWLLESTGMLKRAEQRIMTVNFFEFGENCDKGFLGLEQLGKEE